MTVVTRRCSRPEAGVATAHAVAVTALLALIAVGCLQLVTVVGLRQQAAAAADLAALAASRASAEGGDGCAAARRLARANGARVVGCRMDADVATVTVSVRSPTWAIGRWAATTRARAAPAWYLE